MEYICFQATYKLQLYRYIIVDECLILSGDFTSPAPAKQLALRWMGMLKVSLYSLLYLGFLDFHGGYAILEWKWGCILLSFCFLSVINDSWSFPCLLTVCQIMSKGVVAVLGPSASPASNSIISNICGEKEVSAGIGFLLSSVQHTKAQIILPSNHSYHYCNDRSVQRHALKMIPNHSWWTQRPNNECYAVTTMCSSN